MSEFVSTFKQSQEELFKSVSRVFLGCWFIGVTWSVLSHKPLMWLHVLFFLVVLTSFVLPPRLMWLKHLLLYASQYAVSLGALMIAGTTGVYLIYFAVTIFLVLVMHSIRGAVITTVICSISIVVGAYLIIEGYVPLKAETYILSDTWKEWIFKPILLLITSGIFISTYSMLMRKLMVATEKSDASIAQLRDEVESHRKTERELQEGQQRYKILADNMKDFVWTMDMHFKPIYASPSVFRQRGYTVEEALSQGMDEVITEDTIEGVLEIFQNDIKRLQNGEMARDETRMLEYKVQCKDGTEKWVESMMTILWEGDEPVSVLGVTRDISQRKQVEAEQAALEEQMLQVQKLESLGLLAGGIAHDFNNLLVGILGNVDLAREQLPDDSPVGEFLDDSINNAKHAADLCQQLLAYSGRGRFLIEPTELGGLVRETSHLLEVSVPKEITLEYRMDDDLPLVDVDATQLRQVVMNLVMNASDAMRSEGGTVSIYTHSRDFTREELATGSDRDGLPEGHYVVLEISDTGVGMASETIGKIFDPFFTTKDTGHGLGLAAVLGIVHGHNGTMMVDSTLGEGTTFTIILPSSPEEAIVVAQKDGVVEEGRELGTVLVVDDEDFIRRFVKKVMEGKGSRVLEAENGQAALDVLREFEGAVDLVLLDLMMPVMNGEDAYREMRLLYPDLAVVISSGYSESEHIERFGGEKAPQFLQKPYRLQEMLEIFQKAVV